jgi:hypothetical protein
MHRVKGRDEPRYLFARRACTVGNRSTIVPAGAGRRGHHRPVVGSNSPSDLTQSAAFKGRPPDVDIEGRRLLSVFSGRLNAIEVIRHQL